MQRVSDQFNTRSFWLQENLRYLESYFRLEKCARIVNSIAHGVACDLLDVGCGPASLAGLLEQNIQYYGIDIAIHRPAANLVEKDIAQEVIRFGDRTFDIVVAAGIFEYMGVVQSRKLSEIQRLLRGNGKFVVTYTNFRHINDRLVDHSIYNNIQRINDFKAALEKCFRVDHWFPSSHNWYCSEPRRRSLKRLQLPLERRIPLLSRLFAVNYFFVCSIDSSRIEREE
ncbi:MAG: class I SAM-dependent methyltransferase [Acidobacteriota bacterium]